MDIKRLHPLVAAAVSLAVSAVSPAADINAERERWVAHSRSGDTQLTEAVTALQKLYQESGDAKVRADLIALMLRSGQRGAALAVCADCRPSELSADELANLAKAARDTKQFDTAAGYYRNLQTRFPQNKTGWLGAALVATDQKKFSESEKAVREYIRRFGTDKDIQTAEEYLASQSQSPTGQMGYLMARLSKDSDKESVLKVFRLADSVKAYPVQERLLETYPQYFTQTDRLWVRKNQATSQLRGALDADDQADIRNVRRKFSDIAAESDDTSAVHTAALRDDMTAANAAGKPEATIATYRKLAQQGEQPDYAKESYAKALLATGSPNKARKIYEGIAGRQMAENKRIADETNENLIASYADSLYFSKARKQLANWNTNKTRLDFTQNSEIKNPYHDKKHFWEARLDAWNGRPGKAVKHMDEWIAEHPADPWAQILRGELAYWNGHAEEAQTWYGHSQEFLPPDAQYLAQSKTATAQVAAGNWKPASETAATVSRDDVRYQDFFTRYDESRASMLVIDAEAMKATAPKDSTEWSQDARLYSKRSAQGHRVYVAEQTGYVPNHGDALRTGRAGLGAEISLYPATVTVEAGHGFSLNKKAYAQAGAEYRLGSRVRLKASAAYNSANTPAKALKQDVYAHEYTLGADYIHSGTLSAGIGAGLMDFDDGNLRKTAYATVNSNLFQHDRWQLAGSLRGDYTANKDIPEAYYYNPKNSKNLEGALMLSYTLPLDNRLQFKQTATAGVGRYWQHSQNAENTWQLKYGHDWQFGKKASLNYEIGRRQAMYDGQPEFQNFGRLGLSVKFN
ncbi:poly-beta-1,6 N-acetyl-D-glucosamine export porin PgaA [Neisseria chenwenguii]|uniref:poly-beta-1,6 N-acetyl-D-glucosamine export porin PgaA n=1 Tax=Neisseria chenwenguii TaxID=1853278 RepID=UPI000F4E2F1E|nr:poly-beta-1,6 N-acetyl-D-glucosamine export porin PgaA [Neisseria chenwenguii]ROV56560.1 poly-beta-1,6 N-acetyl-D-glucosamine export porin PgaA [Neisseria chenwenguii]